MPPGGERGATRPDVSVAATTSGHVRGQVGGGQASAELKPSSRPSTSLGMNQDEMPGPVAIACQTASRARLNATRTRRWRTEECGRRSRTDLRRNRGRGAANDWPRAGFLANGWRGASRLLRRRDLDGDLLPAGLPGEDPEASGDILDHENRRQKRGDFQIGLAHVAGRAKASESRRLGPDHPRS